MIKIRVLRDEKVRYHGFRRGGKRIYFTFEKSLRDKGKIADKIAQAVSIHILQHYLGSEGKFYIKK